MHRRIVSTSRQELDRAAQELVDAAAQRGYDRPGCFAVRLALAEAISNAIIHGNAEDASKSVTLEYQLGDDAIELVVTDQGEGFDPNSVPDPTEPENMEIPSGRGIVLMRAYMTQVQFVPPGNQVRMLYRRASTSAG